jgi:mono/diheme cytochrome c family protein
VCAADPTEHVATILRGLQGKTIDGVAYAAAMPAFGDQLSDAKIAAVVNHERTSWGNAAATVEPGQISALR